jgi:hypothetical protein
VRTIADSWAKEMFERERTVRADVVKAAEALIADVRRRYPGEELRCPYMRALDDAVRADVPCETSAPPADLLEAAKTLRAAQRAYLADRGNDAKGRIVAEAAAKLDEAIAGAEASAYSFGGDGGATIPPADLNRRALVEQRLLDAYHGKKALPTREECLDLAKTLGVPDEYREELPHQWLLRGVERLMRDDPPADSTRGRLLIAVAEAVEQYEKAIYG